MLEFNDKNSDTNELRQKLVEYYMSHPKGNFVLYYPKYFTNNLYYNLDSNNIQIKADTKLSCIIIFYDYLNTNLLLKDSLNAYDNDFFFEVIAHLIDLPKDWNYSMINISDIFNREDIDIIIDCYVKEAFENDTLWFEINN
jgi:hypothetical protein